MMNQTFPKPTSPTPEQLDSILEVMTGDAKDWYKSKQVWTVFMAALSYVVQLYTGFIVDPTLQFILLLVVFMVLRFVTYQPVKTPEMVQQVFHKDQKAEPRV